MYKIYNDENILVAESETLSDSVHELLEGNGYTIIYEEKYCSETFIDINKTGGKW